MDISKIRQFKRHIKNNLITPVTNQECARYEGKLWTADLWTLGVCDELLNHNEKKYESEDPKKMRNISGSMEYHLWYVSRHKIHMFDELNKIKDKSNVIAIGEIGRGIDLLIANMVKKWQYVIAYDHAIPNEKYVRQYFNIDEYYATTTFNFLTKNIVKRDCILLINGTSFRQWNEINKHFKYIIWNGKLYDNQIKSFGM